MEHLNYPNESATYRAARNALLDAEIALRRQLETVAAQRRALPPGGEVPEDYVFERIDDRERPAKVRLSELFGEHPSICFTVSCSDRNETSRAPAARIPSTVWTAASFTPTSVFRPSLVAKSPISRLEALARKRGWRNLKMLSTAGNDYDHHYFGDTSKFGQAMRTERGYEPGKNWDEPMYNVFRKGTDGSVRHFWGSEMLYVKEDPGQNHRAGDLVDPVWGLLDMSPEGRGDFFPKLTY
jgi:predicted dithiol-disulfide oxidoreductase (DUF899 family)